MSKGSGGVHNGSAWVRPAGSSPVRDRMADQSGSTGPVEAATCDEGFASKNLTRPDGSSGTNAIPARVIGGSNEPVRPTLFCGTSGIGLSRYQK